MGSNEMTYDSLKGKLSELSGVVPPDWTFSAYWDGIMHGRPFNSVNSLQEARDIADQYTVVNQGKSRDIIIPYCIDSKPAGYYERAITIRSGATRVVV